MSRRGKPPAELTIDGSVVLRLLREQHPDLANLPLQRVNEGWDNTLFRLGEELAVRLPRRAVSAPLIEHEQRWLPALSGRLPLPVPAPVRIGRPGCGFPWSWSVVRWHSGTSALSTPLDDYLTAGLTLGRFLHALHHPAAGQAPYNALRGVPLTARDKYLREHIDRVDRFVDRRAVLDLWERARSARPWPGPPLWIHGDLHPGNLLVSHGRLSAVIDFGDLTAGDPATDLAVAWMFLPVGDRVAFRQAVEGEFNPVGDDTWMRARGWALALALAFLAGSADDVAMEKMGRSTIAAVLSDPEL